MIKNGSEKQGGKTMRKMSTKTAIKTNVDVAFEHLEKDSFASAEYFLKAAISQMQNELTFRRERAERNARHIEKMNLVKTNPRDMWTAEELLAMIQKETSLNWVKLGKDFDTSNALLWSGEAAMVTVRSAEGGEFTIPAFDSYDNSCLYEMGVERGLAKWSKERGFHWEAYDAGTYLAYWD